MDLAVGPLDSPRLGQLCESLEPSSGWHYEKTWFGYKVWKGDARWPFCDLFTMELQDNIIRYAEPVARETWPDEWWKVCELYPLCPIHFGPARNSVRSVKPPAPYDAVPYLRRSFKKTWQTVPRAPCLFASLLSREPSLSRSRGRPSGTTGASNGTTT